MAEIIGLGDQDPANPGNHQDRQGLAWEAELELYTDANDYEGMTEAARHDPANAKFGMSFSNHSYSPGGMGLSLQPG